MATTYTDALVSVATLFNKKKKKKENTNLKFRILRLTDRENFVT